MERVIDIHLRLRFDRRALRNWLAAALVFAVAGDLASENVTLTTYYPAPSGVYTQMITTNNTFLARDAGKVLLGGAVYSAGAGADASAKLDVTGTAYAQKILGTGNNAYNPADPKAADIVIGSDAGTRHDSSIMFWSNASASRLYNNSDVFYLSAWNQDAVTGANVVLGAAVGSSSRVRGNLGLGPSAVSASGRGYLFIDNTNTGCVEQDVTQGLVCGVGTYATFMPGLYVEGWNYANRGGQTLVQTGAGQASTQVWGLNNCSAGGVGCTGNPTWMTLKKDDSVAHIFCCPK
ncbi:MAG: hypothetical protein HY079_03025 [Elusimicrobia bacterium]|nr:hypothetical protein [Elusimicrobiota bacterium]